MDNTAIVEKNIRDLSLEVEATRQDTIKVSSSSKSTLENVKIRIKKKNVALLQKGVIITLKHINTDHIPQRVRLVSSEQTIISFNIQVESKNSKKSSKKKHIFDVLKLGLCLSNIKEEGDYQYMPSHPPIANAPKTSTDCQLGDLIKQNLDMRKGNLEYLDETSTLPNREIYFLGKCKPGGCLDPPFGEDIYTYKPTDRHSPPEHVDETSTLPNREIYFLGKCKPGGCLDPPFGEDIYKYKPSDRHTASGQQMKEKRSASSKHNSIFGLKSSESQNKNLLSTNISNSAIPVPNEILKLNETVSTKTSLSLTYSNFLITYPPSVNASFEQIPYNKNNECKNLNENLFKNSFIEFKEMFFYPKQKTEKVARTNLEIQNNNNIRKHSDSFSDEEINERYVEENLNVKEHDSVLNNVILYNTENENNHRVNSLDTNQINNTSLVLDKKENSAVKENNNNVNDGINEEKSDNVDENAIKMSVDVISVNENSGVTGEIIKNTEKNKNSLCEITIFLNDILSIVFSATNIRNSSKNIDDDSGFLKIQSSFTNSSLTKITETINNGNEKLGSIDNIEIFNFASTNSSTSISEHSYMYSINESKTSGHSPEHCSIQLELNTVNDNEISKVPSYREESSNMIQSKNNVTHTILSKKLSNIIQIENPVTPNILSSKSSSKAVNINADAINKKSKIELNSNVEESKDVKYLSNIIITPKHKSSYLQVMTDKEKIKTFTKCYSVGASIAPLYIFKGTKDPINVILGFQSYINENNERVLKTIDVDKEPERFPYDKVTIVKSLVGVPSRIRSPIDEENYISIDITKVDVSIDCNTDSGKEDYNCKQNLIHTKQIEANSSKEIQWKTNKVPNHFIDDNLISIYEKELVPLSNVFKDLKDEVDSLAIQKPTFKTKFQKPMKVKRNRFTKINRCGCFKE